MTGNGNRIILLVGGARSGKSRYALQLGEKIQGRRAFIATAEPLDEEMEERIREHKLSRSRDWVTIEEPLNLVDTMAKINGFYDVILVDCLTLWLSNMLVKGSESLTRREIQRLKESIQALSGVAIFVSNEVGEGIVPDNKLARTFRDINGWMNQIIAECASEVYRMMCGIPVKIK